MEELEALKELSDEIEENHVEAEKAMQEEIGGFCGYLRCVCSPKRYIFIDEKDMQIHGQLRAIETLQDSIIDYENTIIQFRDVVTGLQRFAPLPALSTQTQALTYFRTVNWKQLVS